MDDRAVGGGDGRGVWGRCMLCMYVDEDVRIIWSLSGWQKLFGSCPVAYPSAELSLSALACPPKNSNLSVQPTAAKVVENMSSTTTKGDGKRRDWLGVEGSDAEEDSGSEQEEESRVKRISKRSTKRRKVDQVPSASEDEDDDEGQEQQEEKEENAVEEEPEETKSKNKNKDKDDNSDELLFTNPNKLKPLSKAELAASKAATSKTGVIYLSRIPVCRPIPPA